ncbi:MAG: TonB-dependent receptor [Gemmatimonadetes bacterium]|nr:TonB-dependent receptor [Gemmatimonadota bacterium]
MVTATRSAPVLRIEQPTVVTVKVPTPSDRALGRVAADLLRDLAGVHVQQTSAGQGAVVLRGLVGNQVLLLVDGVPLNNGTFRDGPGQYLATIDPESVERVEVVRGPASVLYGSDAQGGVVNMLTTSFPGAGRGLHMAATATSATRGGRARLAGGLAGTTWRLGAGISAATAGDQTAGGNLGRQTPTGFDALGLDAKFSLDAGAQHKLTVAAQHFRMRDVPRYDRYVDFRAPAPGADVEHVFDPQARQLVYARHRYEPGKQALTTLEATASLAIQREGRGQIRRLGSGLPDSVREHVRDDVYTPGLSVVGTSFAHVANRLAKITWGGEAYRDRLTSSGYTEVLATGARTTLLRSTTTGTVPSGRFPDGSSGIRTGLFLSAESEVVPRIRVTTGGRWSWFRNEAEVGLGFGGRVVGTSSDLTGQLGIVSELAQDWRLAVRVAEGFRAPNLYDLTNVGPVPGGIQLPNPTALPERSLSVEAGLRYAGPSAGLDIEVYRSTIDDFIDRTLGVFNADTLFNGARVFQGLNVGTAWQRGIEAEALWRGSSIELRGTLLYTHGEQELAPGVREPMSKIPPLNGSGRLKWTAPIGPWVEYVLRWATAQDRLSARDLRDTRIPPGGTPGYAAHGIRAGMELGPDVMLTGGVDNLANALYRDHGSGVDNPGRHVWVGLSWTADF